LGIIGALALGMGVLYRDRLEWYDAYVDVLVSGLRARFGVHDARILSDAGPYLGAALVFVALLVARRRDARPGELLRPLTALAVALLCVELLKLAIYRDRPFNLGPAQHDSFPSGDTAQVALCAATALHLVALRRITRDWLRWGLALIGATAAIAIAISRVYLSRHWVSDVAASLLIGVLFWSAAPRWRVSLRKLALAVSAIAVLAMSGPPLTLPSPMTFDDQRHFELPPATGVPRDGQGQRGSRVWRVRTAAARFSVVQLELVPHAGDADRDDWLHLEVDRDRVASVPLATNRGMYALPLPRLTSGFHEVRLQARQGGRHPLPVSLNLVRVSIEGAAGHVVVPRPLDCAS
jgi:membrane-associated phospholipid phosphatase